MTRDSDPHDPPLTPELLVAAYQQGAFPMAESRESNQVGWFIPEQRAIIPLDTFNCPRSVAKRIRDGDYVIRRDTAFDQVIQHCAEPRRNDGDTWINQRIIQAYGELHQLGIAHSVEAWRDDQLVGGLYGLVLGGAFCGESMFHLSDKGTDASKVCLVHLVEHLNARGFTLLDAQLPNDHLQQFGLQVIEHDDYMQRLSIALSINTTW